MADTVDRVHTPLLTLITAEAIDRDYQVAASRRPVTGAASSTSPRLRVAVVVVLVLFAGLVTVAAAQTTQRADVDTASRADLVQRINTRRDRVAALQKDIARLQGENTSADLALQALGEQFATLRAREASLGSLAGTTAVTGAGVRISLDGPPAAGPDEAVRDSDLTLLANALWEAGAEAVTVNGQRLTGVGAIRNVGEAIEVNGVGVAPPYTVLAIGDPRTLASDVVDTASGLQFLALVRRFGFRYSLRNADDLRLGAAPASQLDLRYAAPVPQRTVPGGGAP